MATVCPSCGWQAGDGTRCPRCGVDIDDYRSALRTASARFASPPAPAEAVRHPERAPPIPATRPAGFWIRFAAAALDGGLMIVVENILGATARAVYAGARPTAIELATSAFGAVLAAAYAIVFHWLRGQTLGKMAVGIRVVTLDGGPLSLNRAIGRQLATVLSALPFGIGYLMVAFRRDKRALHDIVAGTRVERLA